MAPSGVEEMFTTKPVWVTENLMMYFMLNTTGLVIIISSTPPGLGLGHFTENGLTEKRLIENHFTEMVIWPKWSFDRNVIWPKRHLTDTSFYQKKKIYRKLNNVDRKNKLKIALF
jgi:hypothetical protein